jgi:hypothetical protein
MREPRLHDHDGSNGRPFSALTADELKEIAARRIAPHPTPGDQDRDVDFAARYAVILLRERGR